MNVVKELMGHSDIETTAAYYNQVDADHERKAAAAIQGLLEQGQQEKNDVKKTYEQVSDVKEGCE